MAEQTGSVEARACRGKVYDVLSGMKERGLFVSAEDEQALAKLRQKVEGESAQSSKATRLRWLPCASGRGPRPGC